MSGKNLLEGRTGQITQSVEAVKSLLTWKHRASDPLPSVVEFANEGEESRLVLVLSNKKDSYYVTTATKCSCPSQTYRGGPCKHMRKHFGTCANATVESESIRPTGGWIGPNGEKANGPVEPEPSHLSRWSCQKCCNLPTILGSPKTLHPGRLPTASSRQ